MNIEKKLQRRNEEGADDLRDTLAENREHYVGMAANMIGIRKRIIIANMGMGDIIMFNPIIAKKDSPYEAEESCLSLIVVIFYGSNSWAYTRLGKITGHNEKELEDTFGNGDVTIGLSVGAQTASETTASFDFERRSVMLNSGYEMPIMGLGAYSLDHDTCVDVA